ncbi:MAG: HAMP domain-containing sensor histidine kinase [Fusobacteriota bacterium]
MGIKLSIRKKLILVFILIMLLTLGVSSLFSSLFLGKFSIYNNKKGLKKLAVNLKTGYINNSDVNIEEILYKENVKIDVIKINKNGEKLDIEPIERYGVPEFEKQKDMMKGFSKMRDRRKSLEYGFFRKLTKKDLKKLEEGKEIIKIDNHFLANNEFMILITRLKENRYLVISRAIFPIQKAAEFSKRFFTYSLIISLIIGIIIISLTSKKITHPILNLNDITKKISKFDFTTRSNIKSGDEIEELGNNINTLSMELKNKIDELNQANKKLKKDIKLKDRLAQKRKEFISNISHELKTPIAIIGGYAEGLQDNIIEDEDSKNFYAETILDETKNMSRLVEELLELSKLESDSIKFKKDNFDIYGITKKIIEKYKFLNKNKIKFEIITEGFTKKGNKQKSINIMADKNKIEEVIKNYISNAVKNVNENGIIRILISKKVVYQGNQIRVEVYNTGSHIKKEIFEDIWIPFYKIDKSRKRKGEGTGLGLAIVKSIIKKHGGTTGVENTENGVIFYFEI